MSRRAANRFAFIAFIAALVIVVHQLSLPSFSQSDDKGIGGDWKPYAFDDNSLMDSRYLITDGGIFRVYSESDNRTLIVYSDYEHQTIELDAPSDGWITVSPLSSYMPEEPYIINFGSMP